MAKKLYLLIILTSVAFILAIGKTYSQDSGKKKQWKRMNKKISNFTGSAIRFSRMKMYNGIGVNISSMNYFGDIVPAPKPTSTDIQFSRPQIGVTLMRRIGPRYSIRGAFSWGRLSGDDYSSADPMDKNAKFRYVRNLHFRNDIKEISLVSMVDLFENRGNYLRRVTITPYIFGGIAIFHHNPKAKGVQGTDQEDRWIPLQPLQTENKKYSRLQFSIPLGVGLRYRLNNDLDIGLEVGYRYTFTDYLDDVSKNFILPSELKNQNAVPYADRSRELVATYTGSERNMDVVNSITPQGYATDYPGSKRGTPNKDIYIVSGIHITYVFVGTGKFGKSKRNAKFR